MSNNKDEKDDKDQPPVYNADINDEAETFKVDSQPTSLSINFVPHNPQQYQSSQSFQPATNVSVSVSVSVPQLDQYNHQNSPHQHSQSQSQSQNPQPYYSQQSYQVQPNSSYEQTHYNVNTHIIPTSTTTTTSSTTTTIPSHSSPVISTFFNTYDCNKKGTGLTLSETTLPLLANFPKYSNTHPIYSTMPIEYNNIEVLPDLSILSSDNTDVYYNTSNDTFHNRTDVPPAIISNTKPIKRHPFRRPSYCSVLCAMIKANYGFLTLSIIISICFGIFLYNYPSFETGIDDAPYIFLAMFGLFLYLIYTCWFICIRHRVLKYKSSDISLLQQTAMLSDYSILSNAISSPSSYIYPPDIEHYIDHLQHNVGPRLYLNILALEEEVDDEGSTSWTTSYHALRPIHILEWKDISISSHEFLQNLEESGDNFYKIRYKYEYYLTPGQQKMLELMTIECQKEESWRGKSVCVFVLYNTDLQELEKIETSPFASKVYNPISTHPSSIPSDIMTTPEVYSAVDSEDSYLPTSIPSYQRDDNNSSDKLVSYDTQAQYHHVLAYKERKCYNMVRTLFFNPILDWFFILTVFFGFIYSVIYRYCITDYTYYNRKFVSISSHTNPDHDIVRLDVMPTWRFKPTN